MSRLVSKKTLKQGRRPHGPRCVQLHPIRLGLRTSLSTVAPIQLIAFRLNTSSTPGLPQGNLCFHRDWSHRHGDAQGVRAALSRTQPLQSRGDLQVGADGRLLGDPAGESSRSRERDRGSPGFHRAPVWTTVYLRLWLITSPPEPRPPLAAESSVPVCVVMVTPGLSAYQSQHCLHLRDGRM